MEYICKQYTILYNPTLLKNLERTKGATKNGQSRDTDNVGYKAQNEDKTKPPQKPPTKNQPRMHPGARDG